MERGLEGEQPTFLELAGTEDAGFFLSTACRHRAWNAGFRF